MNRYESARHITGSRSQTRKFESTVYPKFDRHEDDIYIITQDGDRLDNLSFEFYNDVQYWWVILAANPNKLRKDSYHVVLGEQIRIPSNPVKYVSDFTKFNKDR